MGSVLVGKKDQSLLELTPAITQEEAFCRTEQWMHEEG
jgi:hypothetical protein